MIDYKDKTIGCMVGGAVGDALGYPVEFMTIDQILRKYGDKGITRYQLNKDGVAEISDDTQMSMFVANGLAMAYVHYKNCTVKYHELALKAWYWTQTHRFDEERPESVSQFWLTEIPQLYSQRAPGNTCMSALSGITENDSKGCGGIMRIAPLPLFERQIPEARGTDLCDSARFLVQYTHKNSLAAIPAEMLSQIIIHLLDLDPKTDEFDIITPIKEYTRKRVSDISCSDYEVMQRLINNAYGLAKIDVPDRDAIRLLGEGWTAEETLAIAVYCCLKHPNSFEDAVIAAVNHSGDSDSTGAVTGNIMGAWLGRKAIPKYFIDNLELVDLVEELATDMYDIKDGLSPERPMHERFYWKYIVNRNINKPSN
jgi:ADP-ribosylglycohydrolase